MNAAGLDERAESDGAVVLALRGRLDLHSVEGIWTPAVQSLARHANRPVIVDAGAVDYCDSAGAALLVDLLRQPRADNAPVSLRNLSPAQQSLLGLFDLDGFAPRKRKRRRRAHPIEHIGRIGAGIAADMREQIAFLGEASGALLATARHPQTVRWRDALAIAEEAGVNALPIVALIAFLMGVIMAFQGAVAMKQFGAEVFVADLVGISLLRELGPLMTAILLAGRTGAAFAAELGTMRVNDEVSALETMGVETMRFLIVPRLIAGIAVMPVLATFADFVGLIGGAVVMLGFDIPLVTYFNEVANIVKLSDFLGGLFKALVFGAIVAGIGCLRGLQTGEGAAAVGLAATRAVVSGIVLIVVADGIFAVVFHQLGI